MYFRKYWLRKIWLYKCLKAVFQRTLGQTTGQMGQHAVATSMAAKVHYLLVTVKAVASEKVSFSDKYNPKSVC